MILNEGYGDSPGPHYISRAAGCQVWDRQGHIMYDMSMGGGSMILGHGHPRLLGTLQLRCGWGTIYTTPHEGVHLMDTELDRRIPWLPARVWCNSGSEAIMRLARIARAVTGKHKIALFSGCWHGSWDGTLVEEDYDVDGWKTPMKLRSPGILPLVKDSLLMLPYRDSAAFSLIRQYAQAVACVLVEPVQGSNPSPDVESWLANLRHTCTDCGVLLAFDEVVTGFRLSPGGGQELFGVPADLAAYGKILGGGLPVGMVAMSYWIANEARRRGVFFGGTFSANPLTIAAGLSALDALDNRVYAHVNEMGQLLRTRVNEEATREGLPCHMMGCGSINRLILSSTPVTSRKMRDSLEPDSVTQQRFYARLRELLVHVGTNHLQFPSLAHSEDDICAVAQAICQCARDLREGK